MNKATHGIHHVTAIAGDPQKNVNFYAGILGMRLVKKTINFDDPFTYHFYFGDGLGNPGTIMTFFPWAHGLRGRIGTGQLTVISVSIPPNAMDFWTERLRKHDIELKGPFKRFEEEVISFHDYDGLQLELVGSGKDSRAGWENGMIPGDYAIRGFYSVALSVEGYERTAGLMTGQLEFRQVTEIGNRFRYESGEGGPGTIVDVLCQPDSILGTMGVGVVHHVAWRIEDDDAQLKLRKKLVELGYNVSPVMDRNYFHSIYFREPGGVLFEGATDPPGFTIDENPEELGSNLMLPSWLEKERSSIENHLKPITLPGQKDDRKPAYSQKSPQ